MVGRLPSAHSLLGDALLKAETARFARAMATLVANSVPLVQSLGISRGILNNRTIAARSRRRAGRQARRRNRGPMRKRGEFPPLAAHLLTVGEETGQLDQMFARMADIYENETRSAIRRFTPVRADRNPGDGHHRGCADFEYAARHHEHQRCGDVT